MNLINIDKDFEPVVDTMWYFLIKGGQQANIPALKEYVNQLVTATTQKTAGQEKYRKKGEIDWQHLDMIMFSIVIEATALVLSGELEKIPTWQILEQLRNAREEAAEEKKSQDIARRVVAEVREDTFDKAISIVETHLNQKPKGFGEKLMDRLTEVYEENK